MVKLRDWGQLRGNCWKIVQILAWRPLRLANAPSKPLAHVRPPGRTMCTSIASVVGAEVIDNARLNQNAETPAYAFLSLSE